jgi:hypothetical protein
MVTLLSLASAAAFASSDIRLQYTSQPKNPTMKINTDRLTVDSTGVVTRETVDTQTGTVLASHVVKQLEASEVDRLNGLVEQARGGQIATIFHPIHCKAISALYQTYTADNGKVFLAKETLCQDPTINTSAAAQALVSTLKGLLRQPRDTERTAMRIPFRPEITPTLYQCEGAEGTKVGYTTSSLAGKPTFSVTFKGQKPVLPPFPKIQRETSTLGDLVSVTDNHMVPVDGPSVIYTLVLPNVVLAEATAQAEFKTQLVRTSVVNPFFHARHYSGPLRLNTFVEVQCKASHVVF